LLLFFVPAYIYSLQIVCALFSGPKHGVSSTPASSGWSQNRSTNGTDERKMKVQNHLMTAVLSFYSVKTSLDTRVENNETFQSTKGKH